MTTSPPPAASPLSYKSAGVDIDAGDALVERIKPLARKTMRVVRQNLLWALLYNAACVPLAVAGLLPAWLAGLGMASSSLLVVANAARLARSAQTVSAMQALQNSKPVIARPQMNTSSLQGRG